MKKNIFLYLLASAWLLLASTASAETEQNLILRILVAEFSLQQHDFAESYLQYKKVLELSDDAQIVERAYKVSLASRKPELIEDAIKRYMLQAPEDEKANFKYLVILSERDKKAEAMAQLENIFQRQILKEEPSLIRLIHTLALVSKQDLAEELALEVVTKKDSDAKSLYALAFFYQLRKQTDKALLAVDRSLTLDSTDEKSNILKVRILLAKDEKDEAVALMGDYYKQHYNERTAELYGQLLFENNKYIDAVAVYKRLLTKKPDNALWLDAIGTSYVNLEDYDNAYAVYLQLIDHEDINDRARYLLGLIDKEKERTSAAIKYFGSVEAGSYYFDAQVELAEMQAKDNLAQGLKTLDGLQPDDSNDKKRLALTKADIYIEHKQYKKAYQIYTKEIAKLDKFNADIYYARAVIAEKMGDIGLTEKDYLLIIEKEPKHYDALNAFGYTLAEKTTRYTEALSYIERALKLEPEKFYILDSMGWVKYKLGKLDESLDYLMRAFTLKADPEVAAHLAEVLWHNGDKSKAEEYLKIGVSLNAEHPAVIGVQQKLGLK